MDDAARQLNFTKDKAAITKKKGSKRNTSNKPSMDDLEKISQQDREYFGEILK